MWIRVCITGSFSDPGENNRQEVSKLLNNLLQKYWLLKQIFSEFSCTEYVLSLASLDPGPHYKRYVRSNSGWSPKQIRIRITTHAEFWRLPEINQYMKCTTCLANWWLGTQGNISSGSVSSMPACLLATWAGNLSWNRDNLTKLCKISDGRLKGSFSS